MRPVFIIFSVLFVVIGVSGVPQFYGEPLDEEEPENFPAPDDNLGWAYEMKHLIKVMRLTFGRMGQIAFDDNEEVGKKIICLLQDQIAKASLILTEFTTNYIRTGRIVDNLLVPQPLQIQKRFMQPVIHQLANGGAELGRFKRQAGGGAEAYNKVAGVMAETAGKIAGEQAKLSAGASAAMDKEYTDGLKSCKSRECKSQLKTYEAGRSG